MNRGQHLVKCAEIDQYVGRDDKRPRRRSLGKQVQQVGLVQFGVYLLGGCDFEHARGEIDTDKRTYRQVGEHNRDQSGTAAEIEHRIEPFAGGYCRVL